MLNTGEYGSPAQLALRNNLLKNLFVKENEV